MIFSQETSNTDNVILEVAQYLDKRLPAKSIVAVLNIESDNLMLSSYIIGELVNAIIELGNLVPVERDNIDLAKKELAFQLSGDVSDESAQAIGKMLGAQIIVSGKISAFDRMYLLEIKAISVETAAIMGTISKNIQIDRKLKKITGSSVSFPISIGGGVHTGGTFTTGTLNGNGKETIASSGPFVYQFKTTETNSGSAFDIGGFMFLDLKYASINVSLYNGSGKSRWAWDKKYYDNNTVIREEKDSSAGNLSTLLFNISILGKYPFYLNNITLYPALGADYQLWLLHTENGKKVPGDLSANNAVWVKLGGGIDYHITRSLFMRGELLWGVKLPSKNERADTSTWFAHSPSAHIGIGYIFNRR